MMPNLSEVWLAKHPDLRSAWVGRVTRIDMETGELRVWAKWYIPMIETEESQSNPTYVGIDILVSEVAAP